MTLSALIGSFIVVMIERHQTMIIPSKLIFDFEIIQF